MSALGAIAVVASMVTAAALSGCDRSATPTPRSDATVKGNTSPSRSAEESRREYETVAAVHRDMDAKIGDAAARKSLPYTEEMLWLPGEFPVNAVRVWAMMTVQMNVDMDGFDGACSNGYIGALAIAIDGYEAIGLKERAALAREAYAALSRWYLDPANAKKPTWPDWGNKDYQADREKAGKIDSRYYQCQEDFYEACARFIRSHPEISGS